MDQLKSKAVKSARSLSFALLSCPRNKHTFRCDQNGPPARREEGAYPERYVTDPAAAGQPLAHFHRNPVGRGWLAVFPRCSLLTYRSRYDRRSRLEKQPTDPATAGRKACLFRGQDYNISYNRDGRCFAKGKKICQTRLDRSKLWPFAAAPKKCLALPSCRISHRLRSFQTALPSASIPEAQSDCQRTFLSVKPCRRVDCSPWPTIGRDRVMILQLSTNQKDHS